MFKLLSSKYKKLDLVVSASFFEIYSGKVCQFCLVCSLLLTTSVVHVEQLLWCVCVCVCQWPERGCIQLPLYLSACWKTVLVTANTHTHTRARAHAQMQNDFIICPMLYAIAMGQINIRSRSQNRRSTITTQHGATQCVFLSVVSHLSCNKCKIYWNLAD